MPEKPGLPLSPWPSDAQGKHSLEEMYMGTVLPRGSNNCWAFSYISSIYKSERPLEGEGQKWKTEACRLFPPIPVFAVFKREEKLEHSSFILCIFRQSNLVHRKQKHADNSISTSKIHWSKGHRQKWERHPVVFGFILNCKCNKKYLEEKILTIPQPALVLSLPVIEHYQ